jgi:hypothetical protein
MSVYVCEFVSVSLFVCVPARMRLFVSESVCLHVCVCLCACVCVCLNLCFFYKPLWFDASRDRVHNHGNGTTTCHWPGLIQWPPIIANSVYWIYRPMVLLKKRDKIKMTDGRTDGRTQRLILKKKVQSQMSVRRPFLFTTLFTELFTKLFTNSAAAGGLKARLCERSERRLARSSSGAPRRGPRERSSLDSASESELPATRYTLHQRLSARASRRSSASIYR